MRNGITVLWLWMALTAVPLTHAEPSRQQHEDGLKSLTEAYVATLDHDLDLQADFYTPTTRFRDPTSVLFGPPWDITGGEQIIEFFRTASEDSGTLDVVYDITSLLVEGSMVVANITASVTLCGVNQGFPDKSFTGDIEMVMVLDFEGHKIKERTDYVGYSAAFDYIEQIKPTLAQREDDPRCGSEEAAGRH